MRLLLATSLSAFVFLSGCGDSGNKETESIVETSEVVETAADIGKAAFASCAVCHNNVKGAGAKMGPNLHGIIGRKAGIGAGFGYSTALKESGITWTEAELDAYIAAPTKKVPGTKMVAGAVTDAEKRKAIIGYLKETAN
jgi:cytochrome c